MLSCQFQLFAFSLEGCGWSLSRDWNLSETSYCFLFTIKFTKWSSHSARDVLKFGTLVFQNINQQGHLGSSVFGHLNLTQANKVVGHWSGWATKKLVLLKRNDIPDNDLGFRFVLFFFAAHLLLVASGIMSDCLILRLTGNSKQWSEEGPGEGGGVAVNTDFELGLNELSTHRQTYGDSLNTAINSDFVRKTLGFQVVNWDLQPSLPSFPSSLVKSELACIALFSPAMSNQQS